MKFLNLIILFTAISIIFANELYPRKKKHGYTGADVCKKCHGKEAIGNQHAIWLASPHAKAVKTLKTKKALEIASIYSIKNPSKNKKCLRCHTTGRGKIKHTIDEGVGCEACHGPGADYHKPSIHVNFTNREKAYVKAKKNGMYPILGIKDIKKREKLCLHCHNRKRPCMPKDRDGIKKQLMTIQVVDQLIKGDIKIRHRLRK